MKKNKKSQSKKSAKKSFQKLKDSVSLKIKELKKVGDNLPTIDFFAVEKHVKKTLVLLVFGACAAVAALELPKIHANAIRDTVGKKSYRITQPGVGWGTGFAVRAPSGQSYILTNDHVCEMSLDQKTLLVVDDTENFIPRRIIQRADFTDLCLLEGMPGVEGLSLASNEPQNGDILAAIGHPATYLVTMTRGEFIMKKDVSFFIGSIWEKWEDGLRQGTITKEQCSLPKNKIVRITEMTFWGKVEAEICTIVTKNAYHTSILSQPGSSGSPVVNFWGNVVGVLFAGDRAGWSILVSLKDVKKFLKMY
jgi:S1-C subfamily serine protease